MQPGLVTLSFYLRYLCDSIVYVMFIPVLLMMGLGRDARYFFEHSYRVIYRGFHQFKMSRIMLDIGFRDGTLSTNIELYPDDIKDTAERLANRKYATLTDYLRETILAANRFMYVEFCPSKGDRRYFDVHTVHGVYEFGIHLDPDNDNAQYSEDILAHLRSMGFRKAPNYRSPMQSKSYSILRYGNGSGRIVADCGRDITLITRLVKTVCRDIYGVSAYPMASFG